MIDIAGAGDDLQMRKMLFYPFHQLKADVRIVYGIDQYFRLFGAGRFQQVDPGGIAVENLHRTSSDVRTVGLCGGYRPKLLSVVS